MTTSQIGRRIGQAIVVLFIAYTLAFFLLDALPSDGVMARYANPELGLSASELEAIREETGIDRPVLERYVAALGGFLTGNFGFSVQTGAAVSTLIADALPTTLTLAVTGFLGAVLIAIVVATLSTFERFSAVGGFFRALPSLLVSLPSFWLGIILIQIFSFQLGWVPVIDNTGWQAFILPILTLAIPLSAPLAQVLIRAIDDVRRQPFITMVRARGASEWWIFSKNVLRNALLPALTMAGLLFGELIGGAVVTEAVFGLAGIGQMTVDAVANRDTPVLLAVVVIATTAFVLINLIIDLLYPVIDPRLRKKVSA